MDRIREAEQFCHTLWITYLEKRDYSIINDILDERLTVIGTGAHEVSRSLSDFVKAATREENEWDGSFLIEDEWYQTTVLSESLYLVFGEIKTKENAHDRIVYDFFFRFTMVLEYQEGNWRLIHIHQSVPDVNQSSDEFFPRQITEQSNRLLQKKIEEKTRELEKITEQVIYYSQYDALSGLMNRHYTEQKITGAMREDPHGVLLMIDIDNFKHFNDEFGHPFGDRVLCLLADCMREAFSRYLVGRIGGDEFIVYMPSKEKKAVPVEGVLQEFMRMWHNRQEELHLAQPATVSIGAALYPEQGKTFDVLWGKADKALYRVKKEGKDNMLFYEERS